VFVVAVQKVLVTRIAAVQKLVAALSPDLDCASSLIDRSFLMKAIRTVPSLFLLFSSLCCDLYDPASMPNKDSCLIKDEGETCLATVALDTLRVGHNELL